MKTFIAFVKKDLVGNLRTGKIFIIAGIFLLFGIMNPVVAKLTPAIMDLFAESLEESGMTMVQVEVNALTSWAQYHKNVSMLLIAFVCICSDAFTGEYGRGTLILILTKGLSRYKIVLSKTIVMMLLWSGGYLLYYVSSYLGTSIFWDNSTVPNIEFSAFCWWLLGILVISFITLSSVIMKNYIGVLLGTGGVFLVLYFISLLPKIGLFIPTSLMNSTSLILGSGSPDEYIKTIVIASIATVACVIASIPIFNKKEL